MRKGAGIKTLARMTKVIFSATVALFALSFHSFAADGLSKWRIEAAPSYRDNMSVDVSGSSRARAAIIEAIQPRQKLSPRATGQAKDIPPNNEDIRAIGERDFDDGYVYTDRFTQFDSFTTNFGYYNNSQQNASGSVLSYHRITTENDSELLARGTEYRKTIRTERDEPIDIDKDFSGAGLKIGALYDLAPRHGVNMALAVGLRGFFGMDKTVKVSNFKQTIEQRQVSYKDYYSYTDTVSDTYMFDIITPVPDAPYSGDIENPVGPLISNLPSSATRDTSHSGVTSRSYGGRRISTWEAENEIDIDIDVDLFQFALGGEFSYDLWSNISFSLRPSLLINLINVDATRREDYVAHYPNGKTESLVSWHEQQSNDVVRLGAAIEAGLNVKLNESWFAGISAGYEWIDETSLEVGPTRVELDLSGFTASVILGIRF